MIRSHRCSRQSSFSYYAQSSAAQASCQGRRDEICPSPAGIRQVYRRSLAASRRLRIFYDPRVVAVLLALALCCSDQLALAANVQWGNSGTTNWSTGSNWIGGSAPGSGDTAVFTGSDSVTPNVSGTVNVGAINITNTTPTAWSITGSSTPVISLAGTSSVTGLSVDGGGTTTIAPTLSYSLSAGNTETFSVGATNSATIVNLGTVSGTGDIFATTGGGTLNVTSLSLAEPTSGSTTNTITAGGTLNITNLTEGVTITTLALSGSGTGTLNGILTENGTLALNKSGTGTWTVSDSGFGATTVSAGTLALNYTTNNTSHFGSGLTMAGGTLTIQGNNSSNTSQTAGGLTLSTGGSNIQVTDGTSANAVLALGAITRSAFGGTVNFTLPAGTQSSSNGITTSTTNTNGILGGWATVGGTTWATSGSSGTNNITGLANGSYSNTYGSVTSSTNFDPNGVSGSLPNSGALNSIRFNNAAAVTITLGTGTTSMTTGGGILVTSNVGNFASTISGGTLSTSSGTTDVIIDNYNTTQVNGMGAVTNALTISSPITTSSRGVTVNGTGTTILSSTSSSFTGQVGVYGGSLTIDTPSGPAYSSLQVTGTGASLALVGSGTANIANASTVNGTLSLSGFTRFNFSAGASGTGTIDVLSTSMQFSNSSGATGGTISPNIAVNASGPLNGGSGDFIFGIGGTSNGKGLTVTGTISGYTDVRFSNNVTTGTGGGQLDLNAANTWTGTTYVDNAGVTGGNSHSGDDVQLGVTNALPTGTALVMGDLTGTSGNTISPILDLNGQNQTVASLASGVIGTYNTAPLIANYNIAGTSTLTIAGTSNGSFTYAGSIANGTGTGYTGVIALAMSGTNTEILTGTLTYTGATSVSGGTLQFNSASSSASYSVSGGVLQINASMAATNPTYAVSAGSLLTNGSGSLGSSAITLNGGTLGGTGTSAGLITVSAGGVLAPGAAISGNAPGTFTANGGITLSTGGSDYLWHLQNATTDSSGTHAGSNYDTISSSGTLNLSALSSSNKLNIDVTGWGSSNTPGQVSNLNLTQGQTSTWVLGTFNSITNPGGGLVASDYTIETNHFTNNNPSAATGTWSLIDTSTQLELQFTAGTQSKTLAWNAPAGGNWDTTTSNTPWLNTVNSSASYFTAADNVTFGNAGVSAGTTTITIDNGNVSPGSVNITNTSGTYAFSGSGIAGSTSVIINGAGGTTIFQNANSYTGGTTITAGTLTIANSSGLPSNYPVAMSSGGTLNLSGNSSTISALSGTGGSINLGTNSATTLTLEPVGSTPVVFGGSIVGSGSLIVTGGSTATEQLSGTNSYSGSTTISSGTLQLGAAAALPSGTSVSLSSGATFDLNSNIQTIAELSGSGGSVTLGTATLTVGDANTTSYAGTITGAGGLTKQGAGQLTVSAGPAYSGTTNVTAGTLVFSTAPSTISGALNTSASGTLTLIGSGVTTNIGTSSTIDGTLNLSGFTRVNFNGSGATYGDTSNPGTINVLTTGMVISNLASTAGGTITANIVLNPGQSLVNGFTTNIGGTTGGDGLTINGVISGASNVSIGNNNANGGGGGLLTLGGQNSWTGTTAINDGGSTTAGKLGEVQLGVNNALPTGTALTFNTLSSSSTPQLDLNGFNQTIASLTNGSSGTGSPLITNLGSGTSTLTINGTSGTSFTYSGNINNGAGGGVVALSMSGTNTEIISSLSATNGYTGATSVSGGTLEFTSALRSASYSVSGGVLQINASNAAANPSYSVTAGSLLTNSSGNLGTGTVTVSGGTLGGSGTGGAVTLSGTGVIAPGTSAATGTLTVNSLTLGTGSAIAFKLGPIASSDQLTVSSSNGLSFSSTGVTTNLSFSNFGGGLTSGTYDLVNYSGTPLTNAQFAQFSAPTSLGAFSLQLVNSISNDEIQLQVSAATAVWNPQGGSTAWDIGMTSNWLFNGTTQSTYAESDAVQFGNTGVGTVIIVPSSVNPSSVLINNTSGTYTFSGTGGSIAGGTGLTIDGAGGTTIFQNANTYTGGTFVTAGTLTIANSAGLPSDAPVTMSSGGTLNLGDNSSTISALSGSGGTVNLGVNSATTLTLEPTSGTATVFGGAITGAGSLALVASSGSVTEQLTGSNSYGGSTTITTGTLQLGASGALPSTTNLIINQTAATFDLNNFNQTIAGLSINGSGSGKITTGTGAGGILTVNASTAQSAYVVISGAGGLTQSGAGTLNITNTPTYTGPTVVSPGAGGLTFTIASGIVNLPGNITVDSSSSLTINGGSTINFGSGANQTAYAFSGPLNLENVTQVNFNNVNGFNTVTGTIDVLTSGITISNSSSTAGAPISAAINLNPNQPSGATTFTTAIGATKNGTVSISGAISGNSSVVLGNSITGGGAGSTTLSAANTWQGATLVDNSGTIGSNEVKLGITNALPDTDLSFNTLTGSKNPNLDLNGFNQRVASLESGTAGNGTSVGQITNNGSSNSVLTIDGTAGSSFTYAGSITDGTGGGTTSLVMSGTNTEILSGANTYSGSTTVSGGVLDVTGSLASTSFIVNGSGTLNLATSSSIPAAATLHIDSSGIIGGGGTTTGTVALGSVSGGGVIEPGVGGTPELLTIGGLSMVHSSEFVVNIAAGASQSPSLGSNYDSVAVTGSSGVNLNSAELVLNDSAYSEKLGQTFDILQMTGAGTISGTFDYNGSPLLNGTFFSGGNEVYLIQYTPSEVILTAVPEPSSIALFGFGSLAMWGMIRRLRRSGSRRQSEETADENKSA